MFFTIFIKNIFFIFFLNVFLLILNQKDGVTPLYVAAQNGHEQTVQILLEKGNPNVELATKVIVILLFLISVHISKINKNYLFIFSFLFPFFLCSQETWGNCT